MKNLSFSLDERADILVLRNLPRTAVPQAFRSIVPGRHYCGQACPCAWHLVRIFLVLAAVLFQADALDLHDAVVLAPAGLSGPEKKAVLMLVEEVEKRTHIRLPETNAWPAAKSPIIAVGPRSALKEFAGPCLEKFTTPPVANRAEGYQVSVQTGQENSVAFVIGNDSRGILFGVGRLLRELRLEPGRLSLRDDLAVATSPKYPLRGHQLGYRPKCNSYDAWDLPVWEQYFRDLAVFGCNAIELLPPRSDDAAQSPHFPRPPAEMMVGMSRLAEDYGLDVWVWYPAMDADYSNAKTVETALNEWAKVFESLPRLDAVFVPGGDPGHTPPKVLMALLEKQTQNLHRFHPKAQMWVSPQGFNQVWLDEFINFLKNDRPSWLSGIVFGPMVRISMPKLRELVPQQYPIRHYPDITHSRQCQYPVPDWDVAYAVTEARECINPRPEGEATIFRKLQPNTIGFITYSEGCNDDVNKCIWSALGWDPDAKVLDVLRQYAHYFIGERYTDDFAQGLLALERNWQGPLLANSRVDTTLAQFEALERAAPPAVLKNWRFQQALFRAYYDAYVRRRLMFETELEVQAMESLRRAPLVGSVQAIATAEELLVHSLTEPVAANWHERIFQLGEALFQSIGMQLSVEKYQAIAVDRGASLDTVDFPLNNRLWLQYRFARIRTLKTEADRLKEIQEILEWTNPGPGGFYDDLGNVTCQSHLVRNFSFEKDPGAFQSPRSDFEEDLVVDDPTEKPDSPRRVSWIDHVEALYDAPLQMRYTGLDPNAQYKIRVLFGGDSPRAKIRLIANEGIEIHPYIAEPFPISPIEFELPAAATRSGELLLSWFAQPGQGGNGRKCQLSEVWLLKETSASGH